MAKALHVQRLHTFIEDFHCPLLWYVTDDWPEGRQIGTLDDDSEKEEQLGTSCYIENFTNFLDEDLPGIVDEDGNWTWTGREGNPEIDGQNNVRVIKVGETPGPPPSAFECEFLVGMPERARYVIDGNLHYDPKFFLTLDEAIESLIAQQAAARETDKKKWRITQMTACIYNCEWNKSLQRGELTGVEDRWMGD